MQSKAFANLIKAYAAKYYALNDPKLAAHEMFVIMETSIAMDSTKKQEATKDFLIKIIEYINVLDVKYAEALGKQYTELALNMFYKIATKNKK